MDPYKAHGIVAALRRWLRPDFDKRDPRLHHLYVVAYNPLRRPGVANRLGMFVTTVRDGYAGRWRPLEATVQPCPAGQSRTIAELGASRRSHARSQRAGPVAAVVASAMTRNIA